MFFCYFPSYGNSRLQHHVFHFFVLFPVGHLDCIDGGECILPLQEAVTVRGCFGFSYNALPGTSLEMKRGFNVASSRVTFNFPAWKYWPMMSANCLLSNLPKPSPLYSQRIFHFFKKNILSKMGSTIHSKLRIFISCT